MTSLILPKRKLWTPRCKPGRIMRPMLSGLQPMGSGVIGSHHSSLSGIEDGTSGVQSAAGGGFTYRYFKWVIFAPESDDDISVAEFTLKLGGSSVSWPGSASVSDNAGSTTDANLIDDSSSTNMTIDFNSVIISIDASENVTFDGYSVTTNSSDANKDPRVWRLYVSSDDSTYYLADTVNDGALPSGRSTESSTFTIDSPIGSAWSEPSRTFGDQGSGQLADTGSDSGTASFTPADTENGDCILCMAIGDVNNYNGLKPSLGWRSAAAYRSNPNIDIGFQWIGAGDSLEVGNMSANQRTAYAYYVLRGVQPGDFLDGTIQSETGNGSSIGAPNSGTPSAATTRHYFTFAGVDDDTGTFDDDPTGGWWLSTMISQSAGDVANSNAVLGTVVRTRSVGTALTVGTWSTTDLNDLWASYTGIVVPWETL